MKRNRRHLAMPRAKGSQSTLGLESLEQRRVLSTVAYYRFEEGTRQQPLPASVAIVDSSGNGLNGVAVNGPRSQQAEPNPIPLTGAINLLAVQFDGQTQRIAIPDSPKFQLTKSLTIEAFVVLRQRDLQEQGEQYIVHRGDDSSPLGAFTLAVTPGNEDDYRLSFRVVSADGETAFVDAPLPTYKLLHVAATLDDVTGRMRLYVDKTIVAESITSVRPAGILEGMHSGVGIGGLPSPTEASFAFNGVVDEVRISDVSLAPAAFLASVPPPVSGDFTYAANATGITVTGYKGSSRTVVVPQSIDGKPVTELGLGAFQGKGSITSITLPAGLVKIGAKAFDGCGALVSVNIPEGVTEIGDDAFIWCGSLVRLDIPASVTRIGYFWAFWGCNSLTAINVDPANVKYSSFSGVLYDKSATALQWCPAGKVGHLALAPTTKTIGYFSFYDCNKITSVTIPASLTKIEASAFEKCSALKSYLFKGDASAIVSDRLYGAGVGATAYYVRGTKGWAATFLGMPTATTALSPSNVAATAGTGQVQLTWTQPSSNGGAIITQYAIQWSTNNGKTWSAPTYTGSNGTSYAKTGLTNGTSYVFRVAALNGAGAGPYSAASAATMPSDNLDFAYLPNDTGIGISGYRGKATVVNVPSVIDGKPVTSIEGSAFMWRGDLTSINIPASVLGVNVHWAFWQCTGLKSINVAKDNPKLESIDGILYRKDLAWLCWVPTAMSGAITLSDTVRTLGYFSFFQCVGLTSVTFPTSVTYIEQEAFAACSGMTAYRFLGDAPRLQSSNVFDRSAPATVYYRRGTVGWGETFGGLPTATTALAPLNVMTQAADGAVSLSWAAPASDGRSPVTDYVVQYRSSDGQWRTWEDGVSTSRQATVTGLGNGVGYRFRVAAVNGAGAGDVSPESSVVVPLAVPGMVNGLAVTPGDGQLSVAWTAPIATGGTAIADYVVQFGTDGLKWTTWSDGISPGTGATITGLINGQPYRVRVAAANVVGLGAYRESAGAVAPFTVPGSPGRVDAMPGDRKATVSWLAPASDGGSAVKEYAVQYSDDDGATWSATQFTGSVSTSYVVSALTNGRMYRFRVSAVNARGTDAFSHPSRAVMPSENTDFAYVVKEAGLAIVAYRGGAADLDVPGTIDGKPVVEILGSAFTQSTSLARIRIPASVRSIDSDSAFNGASQLTAIDVDADNPAFASREGILYTKGLSRLCRVPEGKAGTVMIASEAKAVGDFAFYECESIVGVVIPEAISTIGTAAFDGCVSLRGYFFLGNATVVSSAPLYGANTGARAFYQRGRSGWGPTFLGLGTATTALAPTALVATRGGDGTVVLSWKAPASNGGAAISDYVIQVSSDGVSWTPVNDGVSRSTRATVTGLTNGAAYRFRVAALNAAGIGTLTRASDLCTPAAPPSSPRDLAVQAGNGTALLSWVAPTSDRGSAITDYVVQFSTDGRSWNVFADGFTSKTTAAVRGLFNGQAYSFRVAAVNAMGVGAWSTTSVPVTPHTTPSAPSAVTAIREAGGAFLSWAFPIANGGAAITDFVVQWSADSGRTWSTYDDGVSATNNTAVSGLAQGTLYFFRVAAVNKAGLSAFSKRSAGFVV